MLRLCLRPLLKESAAKARIALEDDACRLATCVHVDTCDGFMFRTRKGLDHVHLDERSGTRPPRPARTDLAAVSVAVVRVAVHEQDE